MPDLKQLLEQCEILKNKIKEFENRIVPESEKSIKALQIKMIKDRLTEIGRQIKNLVIYKDNDA